MFELISLVCIEKDQRPCLILLYILPVEVDQVEMHLHAIPHSLISTDKHRVLVYYQAHYVSLMTLNTY